MKDPHERLNAINESLLAHMGAGFLNQGKTMKQGAQLQNYAKRTGNVGAMRIGNFMQRRPVVAGAVQSAVKTGLARAREPQQQVVYGGQQPSPTPGMRQRLRIGSRGRGMGPR